MRAYAEKALEKEISTLSAMDRGTGRNIALFSSACRIGKYGHHAILPVETIEAGLLDACRVNRLLADDGLEACKATFASGLRKARGDALPSLAKETQNGSARHPGHAGRQSPQSDTLLEIASRKDVELYHTADGTPFADIVVSGHRETWSLKSNGFRDWLHHAYFLETHGSWRRGAY